MSCELIEIKVLDVKDADAIIVVLKKDNVFLVILIDAGRDYHFKKITNALEPILSRTNKSAPDLVICTHYDYDHIGGFDKLIDIYGRGIGEIWMHKTSEIIKLAESIKIDYDNPSYFPFETSELLTIEEDTGIITSQDNGLQTVLTALKHEIEILKKLKNIKDPKEPIYGQCELPGWPEIKVLGPTKEYYKELFPEHFDVKMFLDAEKNELNNDIDASLDELSISSFEKLAQFERSTLSPTNLNSAIILIETDKGKLLFTADAGIESFKNIPNYTELIKDIEWLKVPHHGSANNLDQDLIKLMNPKYAFISGNSHISNIVIDALKENGSIVKTTRDSGNLIFPVSISLPTDDRQLEII